MSIAGSRTNPPMVIIPTNNNHLGAHNEMAPVAYKEKERTVRRIGKTLVKERTTVFEDNNKPKPTPLHPSYTSKPTASCILQGSQFRTNEFPIIF